MRLEEYAPLLTPDIEETADDLLRLVYTLTENPVEIAFYLHQYVKHDVSYEARHDNGRSRKFREPKKCLTLGGNCEEQCVLLASLLEAKDIPTQFVELEKPDSDFGHLSLRCEPGPRGKDITSEISTLCAEAETVTEYQKAIASTTSGLLTPGKRRWYYVDPVMSRYLGDPSGLRNSGYISNQGFDWLCHTRAYDPGTGKEYSE